MNRAWMASLVSCVALAAGAVVAMGVALSGSGCEKPSGGTAGSGAGGEKAAGKRYKIGVSVPAADHGWTAGVGWWAKRAMELNPHVEWVYATATGPSDQIGDLDDMLTKGIDGLVILATESAPLTPAAKKVKSQGVFIVNVDRGFVEPGIADVFLEGDNKAFGRTSARFVADRMRKEGRTNLVILTGIPSTVDTDRVTAGREVFAQYPEIRILDQQPAMWNRQRGLEVMQNLLTKHEKIDAVWAQDDDIMMGAIQAVKEAGREKEMWMVGGAGMKEAVKMVMDRDPMVPANITYPPSMIAAGIQMAAGLVSSGRPGEVLRYMPKHLMIDVELITPENAKDYYFPESVY
ncbi:MAG: substrate-binding domain-containing protein [Phycisphaeraceae bacterium]|nr:MAG: substrate-binding domain-containing protein [Phycisphaeraceae bacterium]